ncbi:hypothetical protein [Campylobacter sp.]|uniref:hypothetical protein n=1 Tax=Campylobacter sp. TaxID=205 RepID=UPI0025BFFB42|nr:hypothetical protein [Campylobacter sp.]
MLISKKTLTSQGNLSLNVIKWAIEVNSKLAILNRPLTIDKEKSKEYNIFYIDDITKDEIDEATKLIKEYCLNSNQFDLLKQYLNIALENDELLNELKSIMFIEIANKFSNDINKMLIDIVPPEEIVTFERQEKEARAFKDSGYKNESLCPMMKIIATTRNISLKTLCDKCIEKADRYALGVATLMGKRQDLEDKIKTAITKEELNKIKWS